MFRVFVKDGCAACAIAEEILNKKGLPYEKVDVDTAEGWDLAQKLGICSTGTVVDEKDEVVILTNL